MELWLRYLKADKLEHDKSITVTSQKEWQETINKYRPINSILWPEKPLFHLHPIPGSSVFKRRHPHEKNYNNNRKRNLSYLKGARELAKKIRAIICNEPCLVYAPMRGALHMESCFTIFKLQLYGCLFCCNIKFCFLS